MKVQKSIEIQFLSTNVDFVAQYCIYIFLNCSRARLWCVENEFKPMVVRIRLYTISTSSRNLLLIQFTQQQHIHRSITIYCMPPYGPYDQVFNTLPHDGEYAISPIGPILKIFSVNTKFVLRTS